MFLKLTLWEYGLQSPLNNKSSERTSLLDLKYRMLNSEAPLMNFITVGYILILYCFLMDQVAL